MSWSQGAPQPTSGAQPNANPWSWMTQGAQQTAGQGMYSPQMVQGARGDLLAQLGMGLMAAGQPMSGAQRAQYLAQLGSVGQNYQQDLAQRLKQQQEAQQYQQQQQQQKAWADVISNATPEQLAKLGIAPETQKLYRSLPAASQQSIYEKSLTAGTGDPNTQVVNVGGRQMLIDQRTGQTVKDLGPVTDTSQGRSPEMITLTPPVGSKEQPQTFNVNDPADYSKAHDLTTRGWTRASAATNINMPTAPTSEQARLVQNYGNIYDDQKTLETIDKDLTSPAGALAKKYGGNFAAYAQSPEYQTASSTATRWVQNLLYIKSGATVPEPEAAKMAIAYFPQPGDSPQVIAAKKRARDVQMMALRASMGDKASTYLDPLEAQINQSRVNPLDLGAP